MNNHGCSSVCPALDHHADWETRRVTMCHLDMGIKRGDFPAKPHRADTGFVDDPKQFLFKERDGWFDMVSTHWSEQRSFPKVHGQIGTPTDANTNHDRGAGSAASLFYDIDDKLFYALNPDARGKHP
jgi:hypothetical protein